MLESDFLMRYVMRFMEQFTAILLAIIFDKKSENYDTALEKINEAYKELLHLNPDEIKCLPTNEIIENNTRNNILDMDNIEVIANLLFQEADILEMINGSSLLSVDYYQKSIELFIMLFNTKNDKKFCKNIEEVIPKLEKYKIKNETEYMLYEYYLKMEMYGKSEDALYHLLENGFPGIENKIKTFYGKLLEKEDDVLEKGNLPRKEIIKAINELEARGGKTMKHITPIIALIISIFIFACSSTQPHMNVIWSMPEEQHWIWSYMPPELHQIMNENRRIALPPAHSNLAPVMLGFTPRDFDIDEDKRIAELLRQQRSLQDNQSHILSRRIYSADHLDVFLSHEKLKEEINFFFDLLSHAYAGYWYFGGDEVFLPIRDAMLRWLAGMNNPLQVSRYLNQLIIHLWRAINDNHFQIHNIALRPPRYVLFMNDDLFLQRYNDDFTIEIDGTRYRVLEIITDVSSPSNGILPTLTQEGEFAWVFGVTTIVTSRQETKGISVLLENIETNERYFHAIELHEITSPRIENPDQLLLTHEIGGNTVLENRSLSTSVFSNQFFQSGYALRNEPILIMDLRGHRGGFSPPAQDWIRGYTGQRPVEGLAFIDSTLSTFTANELRRSSFSERIPSPNPNQNDNLTTLINRMMDDDSLFEIDRFGRRVWRQPIPEYVVAGFREAGLSFLIEGLIEKGGAPRQLPIPNENLVIVLMDNNIASAGEIFVSYLRQLENVLFIGTHTRGSLLTSGVMRTALPYSNIDIMFGGVLSLRPDLSQFEGLGFKPDLWVPPGESLERVLRFIERYGLAR